MRALARSAGSIPVSHPDLEKVTGDALDRGVVKQAPAGVDAVIQTLGVAAGTEMILKPVRLFSEATSVLVAAMEETGVKRLICLTGFGAGDSRNKGGLLYNTAFHLFLGRAYDDKDVQEQIIRRSMLDWVIARPVILTNGLGTQLLPGAGRAERLAMRFHLARRRRRFSGQADRRQLLSGKNACSHELRQPRSA